MAPVTTPLLHALHTCVAKVRVVHGEGGGCGGRVKQTRLAIAFQVAFFFSSSSFSDVALTATEAVRTSRDGQGDFVEQITT